MPRRDLRQRRSGAGSQGHGQRQGLCCSSFGARPIPEELVRAGGSDEFSLRQRLHEVSAVLKAGVEEVAHASSLSQAQSGTCRDVCGIDKVERGGVVLGLVGKTLHTTGVTRYGSCLASSKTALATCSTKAAAASTTVSYQHLSLIS